MINWKVTFVFAFFFFFLNPTGWLQIWAHSHLPRVDFMWTALPPGRIGNITDVSTYHITVVKCRGRVRSLFWCLLNKAAWDCSPSPCGLSSRVRGIWVTHCTSGPPSTPHHPHHHPGGPGTGRGRLTNCKRLQLSSTQTVCSPQRDWLQQMS